MTAKLLLALIRAYRLTLSPYLGGACRFLPTCSVYAMEAIERHGAWRGSLLTLRRLSKCHPLGSSGFDPVPGVHGSEASLASLAPRAPRS